MTEKETNLKISGDTDGTGSLTIQWDPNFDADCPHCDRTERFKDELTARAWMTGHIQEEHSDKLPGYEGRE